MRNRLSIIIGVLFLSIVCSSTAISTNICGDSNDDGAVNIGDAVHLVNYIFRGGDAPLPLDKTDVNNDGSTNIGDVVRLTYYIFGGGLAPACPVFASPGQLLTSCKISDDFGLTSSTECIDWEYDGISTLSIQHINAVFNCCLQDFAVEINVMSSTITITEIESDELMCDCICRFDVEYDVLGIEPGVYTIIVQGPYTGEVIPAIQFEADLSMPNSGMKCETRGVWPFTGYPPDGGLVDMSECKLEKDDPPECLNWFYDGYGNLLLTHVNAVANCCLDSLYADITIEGSDISISEIEDLMGSGCSCLCPYDLEYGFTNIAGGTVTISLTTCQSDFFNEIEVTIDLGLNPEGSYCLE
ncbi:MAG: dockerin type I domain-containing protein [Candidatus Zixiibacteriota bacterium]